MRRAKEMGIAVLLVALAGCSSPVAPRSRIFAPLDPDIPPRIYVTATSEREAVLAALVQSDFSIAHDLRDTPLVLAVRLGSRRATQPCGWVRNVSYELLHEGVRIAVIKGRGWTGSCSPNILRDMGAELRRLFRRAL